MKPLKQFTEKDMLELRIRLDGILRKMIFFTGLTVFVAVLTVDLIHFLMWLAT